MDLFDLEALSSLLQVVAIDVALAGDNAIVVGLAAAGLAPELRRKAIFVGIMAAAGLRVVFALFTVQLLQIIGLMLAGGLLLLWVCWKMWRELREGGAEDEAEAEAALEGGITTQTKGKNFKDAVTQIIVADVSMSLDNVLAVAGAAREHVWVLVVGLGLSVALMGLAASLVAKLLHKHRWVGFLGLAIILYVALKMIWDGAHELAAVAATL